jgi:hypothetical protein
VSNLTRLPYRSAAIVEPEPVNLPKLPGFNDRECMACGAAFRSEWVGNMYTSTKWFRMGRRRWWQRKCSETRPHMHLVCKACGAQWITAPQSAGRFVT